MHELLIDHSASLLDVLNKITKSGKGIVFVMEGSKILGTISDGDIRRKIAHDKGVEISILELVNRNFHYATLNDSPVDIQKMFGTGIRYLPLLDLNGELLRILEEIDKPIIPVCEPNLGAEEKKLVQNAIEAGWISSSGRYVSEFESLFSNYVGSQYAISVANGTLGLVLALKLMSVGEGDEVIVPNLTFGATANAVIQCGAIPKFVDVHPGTYLVSIEKIRAAITPRTKAIIPVHLYGYAADMFAIRSIAHEFELKVIEDAAEAIGSRINNQHVGTFGDIGVFSFYANKTITTGEGGMIVFNDSSLVENAVKMRAHGFSSQKRYWHDTWGSNFRLTNLQAALGVGQMSRIQDFVKSKVEIYSFYRDKLSNFAENKINFIDERVGFTDSYWLSTIKLVNPLLVENLKLHLQLNGVETRRIFYPLHSQPAFIAYADANDGFENSEEAYIHGLCLPSSTNLRLQDLDKICNLVMEFVDKN